jgi:glycosyltransferase involved in cell wall biosynthesis
MDQEFEVKRIRVLRVMARFNLGGPALQITSLMTHLNQNLFEQKLVVGQCAEDEIDYSEVKKLGFEIQRNKYLGRRVNMLSDFRALMGIVRIYYQFKPDIVHSHTAKAGVICRVARLFYFRKLNLVHTYHGHLLFGYFNKSKTNLVILLERLLATYTKRLVTVGSRVKKDLVAAGIAGSSKFIVIPPGIDFEDTSSKQIRQIRKLHSPLRIGFVGRVTQIKRPDKFLAIAEALKSKVANIEFYVAGDGVLLEDMKAAAQRKSLHINFLGWVGNVEKLFQELDLIILTSDNEGTPISIIQAAAQGCIALSTDVGSVEDVLQHGETGFLCNDTHEFAERIEKLHKEHELLQRMQQSAQEFALKNFTGVSLAQNHEKLYLSMIHF